MTLLDVPTKLSRTQLTALIRSLGIDPSDAIEMHITPSEVSLLVAAKNDQGKYFSHADGSWAQHTIAMEIVEDE